MKLIVGLGNPSSQYNDTRHNIGFMCLDYIFGSNNFLVNNKMESMEYITNIGEEKVIVIKPLTYMNLSGDAVLKYINYYKIDVNDLMVIQDDMDMVLGNYKLLYNHGAGGHNGIKDITLKLGRKDYLRLKIGIGKSLTVDTKDYVLGKFSLQEKEILNQIFFALRDIVNDYVLNSRDNLIQKYNTKIHKE